MLTYPRRAHAASVRCIARPVQIDPSRLPTPLFRAAVTRVEVGALVLDRDGAPVPGLTAADFEVLENGVPQVVKSFAPFTFQPDLLVLPNPISEA